MTARRVGLYPTFVLISILVTPRAAAAQWYFGGYLGAAHTQNATVAIRLPSNGIALDFHDVEFRSEWQKPRRYYGLRFGRMGWPHGLGLELELIHHKAIADTTKSYPVSDAGGTSLALIAAQPMELFVQEYRMTHGLNYAFVNLVDRHPLDGERGHFALMLRAGAGPSFPHAETIVNGATVHHYEYAGFGGQGSAGLAVRLPFRTHAFIDYKLAFSRPDIQIAGGYSTMKAVSHHLNIGMTIDFTSK